MSEHIDLARLGASDKAGDTYVAPDEGNKKKDGKKRELPPGAVGWKHGWVPVDSAGNPVKSGKNDKGKSFIAGAEAKHKAAGGKSVEEYGKEKLANKVQADKNRKEAAANKIKAAQKRAAAAKKSGDAKEAKAADEAHKAATTSSLLGSDPASLSEEGLDAALSAAKQKLEDAGYSDQAQAVVDRIKAEVQARNESEGKDAEAEHLAKTEVADKMVSEGKQATVQKAAVNRAKAEQEKQDSTPEAKRANVAKQAAAPESAAARVLAKLPPAEKKKIALKAKIAQRAAEAKTKAEAAAPKPGGEEVPKPEVDPAEEKKKPFGKKAVQLSNGVSFTIDLANAPKGQLAFRYKHGWIIVNPMVPSRGKMGGALARKFGVKSGTTTKGYFTNTGKSTEFIPTSTGHKSIPEQMKDIKNKLMFDVAQKKEDAALKAEVEEVKADLNFEKAAILLPKYKEAQNYAEKLTDKAAKDLSPQLKANIHTKAAEAHAHAQTLAADLAEISPHPVWGEGAAKHSDMALEHQKKAQQYKLQVEKEQSEAENRYMGVQAKAHQASLDVLSMGSDDHKAKGNAHLNAAVAHQDAADLAEAAGKHDHAKMHLDAVSVQQKNAKHHLGEAKKEELVKAHEKSLKAKAAEAKKTDFVKIEGEISLKEGKVKVPAIATPSGKLMVHKKDGDKSGWVVTSTKAGLKMPGVFTTQKEAKAAALWMDANFPGKEFSASGIKAADPVELMKFKGDMSKHMDDHTWPGYEKATKAKKSPDQLSDEYGAAFDKAKETGSAEDHLAAAKAATAAGMSDKVSGFHKNEAAKASGKAAGEKAYASLNPKTGAIAAAIASVPKEEYDKAPPSAWKNYFGNTYDMQKAVHGDTEQPSMEESIKYYTVLKDNGVSSGVLLAANQKILDKIKADGPSKPADSMAAGIAAGMAKPAPAKTAASVKINLPGPGMYADGNAIKAAVAELQQKVDAGADSDGEIQAFHKALQEAKAEFKQKHGVEYKSSSVEASATPNKPFMGAPPVPKGFDDAKAAGFEPVSHSVSANEGWKPTGAAKTKQGTVVYSGSSYSMINAQLRKYGPTGGSNDNTIAVMDLEFAQAPPLSKSIVVGRKMSGNGPFPEFPPPMTPGSEYVEPGYSSTSKDPYAWSGDVIMEVRIPQGTSGVLDLNHANGSSHSSEQEVLLNRGTKFRVVSDSKAGYERKIVVEVIQ